jgi:hypothetical protein
MGIEKTVEAEEWQVLRGRVGTGIKENWSSTGRIGMRDFPMLRPDLPWITFLKLCNNHFMNYKIFIGPL